jgi:hypothetical protein
MCKMIKLKKNKAITKNNKKNEKTLLESNIYIKSDHKNKMTRAWIHNNLQQIAQFTCVQCFYLFIIIIIIIGHVDAGFSNIIISVN